MLVSKYKLVILQQKIRIKIRFFYAGIYLGPIFFKSRRTLCTFIASFCQIICATSLFNIGILAFNRLTNIENLFSNFLFQNEFFLFSKIYTNMSPFIVQIMFYPKEDHSVLFDGLASRHLHRFTKFFWLGRLLLRHQKWFVLFFNFSFN